MSGHHVSALREPLIDGGKYAMTSVPSRIAAVMAEKSSRSFGSLSSQNSFPSHACTPSPMIVACVRPSWVG